MNEWYIYKAYNWCYSYALYNTTEIFLSSDIDYISWNFKCLLGSYHYLQKGEADNLGGERNWEPSDGGWGGGG